MARLLNIQPQSVDSTARAIRTTLTDVNLFYSNGPQKLIRTGLGAINNMIENVLLTVPGERHYEPLFGSGIVRLLYEPGDNITAWRMETASFDALALWMNQYIQVIRRKSTFVWQGDAQQYNVSIAWYDVINKQPGVYTAQYTRLGGF